MPWTAARTTECWRQCPLGTAQQLVYYAVTVLTAARNRVTKAMSVAPLLGNNWCGKKGPAFEPSSTSLLLIDLFWANLTVQHHLPPLALAKASNFFCESPAHFTWTLMLHTDLYIGGMWVHARRHLPSAVPWISQDRLFTETVDGHTYVANSGKLVDIYLITNSWLTHYFT